MSMRASPAHTDTSVGMARGRGAGAGGRWAHGVRGNGDICHSVSDKNKEKTTKIKFFKKEKKRIFISPKINPISNVCFILFYFYAGRNPPNSFH